MAASNCTSMHFGCKRLKTSERTEYYASVVQKGVEAVKRLIPWGQEANLQRDINEQKKLWKRIREITEMVSYKPKKPTP